MFLQFNVCKYSDELLLSILYLKYFYFLIGGIQYEHKWMGDDDSIGILCWHWVSNPFGPKIWIENFLVYLLAVETSSKKRKINKVHFKCLNIQNSVFGGLPNMCIFLAIYIYNQNG